jgi:hypothetical protein
LKARCAAFNVASAAADAAAAEAAALPPGSLAEHQMEIIFWKDYGDL